jgi:hypothetical protein
VGVQAFRPKPAVERLDEAVVGRLAGPRELQGDRARIGPQIEIAADELAAIVHPDRLRIAELTTHLNQRLPDVIAVVGEPRISGWTAARMRIDDCQKPQLPTQGKLVMDDPEGGEAIPSPRPRSARPPPGDPDAAWPSPGASNRLRDGFTSC